MLRQHIKYFTIVVLFVAIFSCTTVNNNEIEYISEDIRNELPESVVDFLDINGWDFSNYKTSPIVDNKNYTHHQRYYYIEDDLDILWSEYTTQDARDSWNGAGTEFGLLYSPENDAIFTINKNEELPLAKNQVLFLNLKFFNFLNICVSFKINKIDENNKTITFRYLEKNFVNGYQVIKLIPILDQNGNIYTIIEHESFYRSKNVIQNTFYPAFHTKVIDNLHTQLFKGLNIKYKTISKKQAYKFIQM